MKAVKIILLLAAFLITIAAVTNLLMIRQGGTDIYGVYLEITAIGFIALAAGIINFKDKRQNK